MKRSAEELLEEKLFHKKETLSPLDFHVETREVRVWVDEADQDAEPSVPLTNRIRKLRKTESEMAFTPAQLESRLRDQYKKLHPTPSWAQKRAEASLSFLTEVTPVQGDFPVLSPQFLDIVRLKDANISDYSKGVVEAVDFHPSAPVVLTAGLDRTIRLFHIDGKVNQKISSIFIKDMPILSAKFSVDGKEIYVSGKRKYFYVYHIDDGSMEKIPYIRGRTEKSLEKMFVSACGNFVAFLGDNGSIILVSTKTKQWVSTLKMNGTVSDIAFSNDGDTLFSIGSDAEVYRWDLKSMECIGKLRDVGAIDPVRIAVSPDLKYLAIGLKCGIVNVYDMDGFSTEHSMVTLDPIKSIPNLTTAIHTLQFHPSSQMLLIGSRETKDCMRLVHLPSIQVFPNWPTQATPIGYLNCASFSPSGLYMTLGNAKGKCLLYSLESFLSS